MPTVHDHGMPATAAANVLREACLALNAALKSLGHDCVYVLALVPVDATGLAGEAMMGSNMRPEEAQELLAVLAGGASAAAADATGVPQ